jgi:hypothetical protein
MLVTIGVAALGLNSIAQVPSNGTADALATPASTAITAPLEYRETARAFLYRNIPVECRTKPFPKEPARLSGQVMRGVLKFGGNPSNAVSFLWQPAAQKLHLERNQSQDLAGAAGGVFSGNLIGPQFVPIYHQIFTNIALAFPATSAGAPMLMDIDLFQYGDAGQLQANVSVHSYWSGRVTVGGEDWQVGLIQNLSDRPGSFQAGQLLLRPWAEQGRSFFAAADVTEDTCGIPWTGKNQILRASDAFAFSSDLFFGSRAWHLGWSADPQGPEEKLALRLVEQPTALGNLRLTGNFIHRLVLTGGPYLVVLDDPPANVKLPPGRYQPFRLWLKQGDARAYFEFGLPPAGKANVQQAETGAQMPIVILPPPERGVFVNAVRAGELAVGGPLTNVVTATRRGQNLLLRYQLLGAGGQEYWLAAGGDHKPPRFTVSQAGSGIGMGQFEFG